MLGNVTFLVPNTFGTAWPAMNRARFENVLFSSCMNIACVVSVVVCAGFKNLNMDLFLLRLAYSFITNSQGLRNKCFHCVWLKTDFS